MKNGHRQQLTQIQIVSIGGADVPKAKKSYQEETTEEGREEILKPAKNQLLKKLQKRNRRLNLKPKTF